MNRAWIVGNAPSIAKLDMRKLKDEATFSFNRAYLAYDDWGWYPTYYAVIDPFILKQTAMDINTLIDSGKIKEFYFYREGADEIIKADNVHLLDLVDEWGFNPDRFKYCGDVAAFALQLAYYHGYRDIYLVGVDQSWGMHGETKPNADTDHFRPDYETDEVRMSKIYSDGHFNSWMQSIKEATAEPYNMKITTTTKSRLNDCLPYIPFDEVLA